MSDGSLFAEKQLELFDVTKGARPQPRRLTPGWIVVPLRHDQVILAAIAGLIGLTVVFATGVERGKQLVRAERAPSFGSRVPAEPSGAATRATPTGRSRESQNAATSERKTPSVSVPVKSAPAVTAATKVAAAPPAAGSTSTSRYAIQVVTYRTPQSAKRELNRLHANGEPGFLVMRNGYTVVYVGPFPSKAHAKEKVAELKPRYSDCFLKTL